MPQTRTRSPKKESQKDSNVRFHPLAARNYWIEYSNYKAQVALQNGIKEATQWNRESSKERNKWDAADINFKRRRTQVARDIADAKVKLATDEGGAFNYGEQIAILKNHFLRDFLDVLARVAAASQGLKVLYDRSDPLPASVRDIIEGRRGSISAIVMASYRLISSCNPRRDVISRSAAWKRTIATTLLVLFPSTMFRTWPATGGHDLLVLVRGTSADEAGRDESG